MARRKRGSRSRNRSQVIELGWQASMVIVLLGLGLAYFHNLLAETIWTLAPDMNTPVAEPLENLTGYVLLGMGGYIALAALWAGLRTQFTRSRHRRKQRSMMTEARHAANASRTLDELEWQDFEYLVGQIFQEQGYSVEVQQGSKDGGVDIVMRNKQGHRLFVQCKHWRSTNVGAPTVREMAGTVLLHKADQGAIVCSGRYTRDAVKEAELLNIKLIDGKQIREYLGKLCNA